MRLTLLQRRQARLDGRHLRRSFGNVEVSGNAVGQAQLRELQTVARDVEVLLSDRAGALHAAQLNVVLSGFGQHRQQHAATIIFGDFEGRVGRLGFAAHAAPEIQFPRCRKACVPQVERRFALVAGRIVQAFGAVAFAPVTARGGGVRVAFGSDYLAGGAALLQATAGEFEVEVIGERALAQR